MSKRKKRFKLTLPGILFLSAIGVLVIAMIAVIIALAGNCSNKEQTRDASAASPAASELPEETASSQETANIDVDLPEDTDAPQPQALTTPDPDSHAPAPIEPVGSDPQDTAGTVVIAPTPETKVTPTPKATEKPSPTIKVYVKPSNAQKKAAKNGHVSKDKVNMRRGPGTDYSIIKKEIKKNTNVTLYELQNGWWFVKCDGIYGYIRKDMIKTGKAATPKPTATPKATPKTTPTPKGTATPKATVTPKPTATPKDDRTPGPDDKTGTIRTASVAALRESPSTKSRVLRELKNGEEVTVFYKCTGDDGKEWYYVQYGSKKGFVAKRLVKAPDGVPVK